MTILELKDRFFELADGGDKPYVVVVGGLDLDVFILFVNELAKHQHVDYTLPTVCSQS